MLNSAQYNLVNYLFGAITAIVAITFIFYLYAIKKRLENKGQMYKDVLEVIRKNRGKFACRGLRWVVPEGCYWIELWLDYKIDSRQYGTTNEGSSSIFFEQNSDVAAPLQQLNMLAMEMEPASSQVTGYEQLHETN